MARHSKNYIGIWPQGLDEVKTSAAPPPKSGYSQSPATSSLPRSAEGSDGASGRSGLFNRASTRNSTRSDTGQNDRVNPFPMGNSTFPSIPEDPSSWQPDHPVSNPFEDPSSGAAAYDANHREPLLRPTSRRTGRSNDTRRSRSQAGRSSNNFSRSGSHAARASANFSRSRSVPRAPSEPTPAPAPAPAPIPQVKLGRRDCKYCGSKESRPYLFCCVCGRISRSPK